MISREKINFASKIVTFGGVALTGDGVRRWVKGRDDAAEFVREAYLDAHGSNVPEGRIEEFVDEVVKNGYFLPTYELPAYDDAGEPLYAEDGTPLTTLHIFNAGEYALPEEIASSISFSELELLVGVPAFMIALSVMKFTGKRG